jgi:hypothetical protein
MSYMSARWWDDNGVGVCWFSGACKAAKEPLATPRGSHNSDTWGSGSALLEPAWYVTYILGLPLTDGPHPTW